MKRSGSSCHVELGDVTLHKIGQLRKLNQAIYPFSYNHSFYEDVLEIGELAKLVYFNDIVVGAVCCSVDHSQDQKRLYIVTLGCLTSYRRLGIGTVMLNHVLNICDKDNTYDNIYTHVQISNKSAINFYQRFRFSIVGTEKNFYQELERPDAHVLQRSLHCPCVHLTRQLHTAHVDFDVAENLNRMVLSGHGGAKQLPSTSKTQQSSQGDERPEATDVESDLLINKQDQLHGEADNQQTTEGANSSIDQ